MIKKVLLLPILTIIFGLTVHSQEANAKSGENKEAMSPGSAASPEGAAKVALNIGAKMPAFKLKDAVGNVVSSESLLKRGNLVIVFYRGSWCPFCNLYLRKLQQNLQQIKDNKGILVAISVEDPDSSLSISKKNELQFTVLSDPNLAVARKFG